MSRDIYSLYKGLSVWGNAIAFFVANRTPKSIIDHSTAAQQTQTMTLILALNVDHVVGQKLVTTDHTET